MPAKVLRILEGFEDLDDGVPERRVEDGVGATIEQCRPGSGIHLCPMAPVQQGFTVGQRGRAGGHVNPFRSRGGKPFPIAGYWVHSAGGSLAAVAATASRGPSGLVGDSGSRVVSAESIPLVWWLSCFSIPR